jgi:hypothetical protein
MKVLQVSRFIVRVIDKTKFEPQQLRLKDDETFHEAKTERGEHAALRMGDFVRVF